MYVAVNKENERFTRSSWKQSTFLNFLLCSGQLILFIEAETMVVF